MASTDNPKPADATELRASDRLEMLDYHRPKLVAADYVVSVRQTIEPRAGTTESFPPQAPKALHELHFSVRGPRFVFDPAQLHSVFPPDGSDGDHAHVLPHVVLERSTLPWERTPLPAEELRKWGQVAVYPEEKPPGQPPWLALLVFDHDEVPDSRARPAFSTVTYAKLDEYAAKTRDAMGAFDRESGQNPEERIRVVDVPWKVLRPVLPTFEELRRLAHVRQVHHAGSGETTERALVVANRLPKPNGTSSALLVSLEGRYSTAATRHRAAADPHHGLPELPADKALAKWVEKAKQAKAWAMVLRPESLVTLVLGSRGQPQVEKQVDWKHLPRKDLEQAVEESLPAAAAVRLASAGRAEAVATDPDGEQWLFVLYKLKSSAPGQHPLARAFEALGAGPLPNPHTYPEAKVCILALSLRPPEAGPAVKGPLEALRSTAGAAALLLRPGQKPMLAAAKGGAVTWREHGAGPLDAGALARALYGLLPALPATLLAEHGRATHDVDLGGAIGRVRVVIRASTPAASSTDLAPATEHLKNAALPKLAAGAWKGPQLCAVVLPLDPEPGFAAPDGAGDDTPIRLVLLRQWRFRCTDPKRTFSGLLKGLNRSNAAEGHWQLPPPKSTDLPERAKRFVRAGHVALPHRLRNGERTLSWYRGPLLPEVSDRPKFQPPVLSPDQLLLYEETLGMLDVSYAAAWQLGRLLMLHERTVSLALYRWKRAHAKQAHAALQWETELHLPHAGADRPPPRELPEEVAAWFTSLDHLEPVPFDYLAADPRLLPRESIRFFDVDPAWQACLRDGAFSIGRVLTQDQLRDQTLLLRLGPTPALSGFLLRSEVVAGWPGLEVDAYAAGFTKKQLDSAGRKGGDPTALAAHPTARRPLHLVRRERLGRDVLLCLFRGQEPKDRLRMLDLHLHPQVLHFGLDKSAGNGGWSRRLRNPQGGGGLPAVIDPVPFRHPARRILDVELLAETMRLQLIAGGHLPHGGFTTADFALSMLDAANLVRLVRKPFPGTRQTDPAIVGVRP